MAKKLEKNVEKKTAKKTTPKVEGNTRKSTKKTTAKTGTKTRKTTKKTVSKTTRKPRKVINEAEKIIEENLEIASSIAEPKVEEKIEKEPKRIERSISSNDKVLSIKAVSLFLFLFFLIIFVQSIFKLSGWYINNKKSEKLISNIRKEVVIDTSSETEETKVNPIDFEKLLGQNEDTVGWIKIDDTNIDYPIVKTENNDYYLTRDFNKKKSSCGWIFMDYMNNGKFIDKNTVLYGHNLKSNYMFADLQKIYKNEIDSSAVIKVYTPTEMLKYRIFSCYMESPDDEYAIKSNIVTEDDTENYIKEILNRSEIKYNVVPDKSGKLLTLSTCDKSGENRILVHCVYIGSEKY